MAVPNTFGTATSAIPLSQLDANFNTPITLGNTAIQLGDTVTTLNNMTLANVTISSGNVTITNVAITTANVSGTANISTLVVVGNATVGGNTTITGNITAANANVTTNLVLSGGTAGGVAYLSNPGKVLTTGSALVFDGSSFLDLKAGANQRFYRSDNARYGFIYADNNGLNIGATSANGEELRLSATGAQYFYVGATPTIAMTVASATGGVGAVGIGYTSLTSVGNNGLAVLGNVGIGTSSPTVKLQINQSSSTAGLRLLSTNATTQNMLQIFHDDTKAVIETSYLGSGAFKDIVMQSQGGNLGLGVTPSAWTSTWRANQVLNASFVANNSQAYMNYNAYYDAGWKYIANGVATSYLQDNDGAHIWYKAPSWNGTGSPAITFTQAMTLDASGNLGLGTTSTSGRRLIVKGSSVADGAILLKSSSVADGQSNGFLLQSYGPNNEAYVWNFENQPIIFGTSATERARFDSSGVFVQRGATTAAGIKPTAIANNESITTVDSTTYTINLGTSAKLFWIALGNGDGALVFTSYLSSSITFLGITPNTVAATASPSSAQLGISKSANSHDIVIKTGSALSSTAAAWQMGVLSSQVA